MKVVRAICLLCQKADLQYKKEQCENDIKYKIIKYAYGKNTKSNPDSLQLTDSRTGECYQNHQQYTAPSSSSQNISGTQQLTDDSLFSQNYQSYEVFSQNTPNVHQPTEFYNAHADDNYLNWDESINWKKKRAITDATYEISNDHEQPNENIPPPKITYSNGQSYLNLK